MKELLTRSEVAKYLKVSTVTVKRWQQKGIVKNVAPIGSRKPLYRTFDIPGLIDVLKEQSPESIYSKLTIVENKIDDILRLIKNKIK